MVGLSVESTWRWDHCAYMGVCPSVGPTLGWDHPSDLHHVATVRAHNKLVPAVIWEYWAVILWQRSRVWKEVSSRICLELVCWNHSTRTMVTYIQCITAQIWEVPYCIMDAAKRSSNCHSPCRWVLLLIICANATTHDLRGTLMKRTTICACVVVPHPSTCVSQNKIKTSNY